MFITADAIRDIVIALTSMFIIITIIIIIATDFADKTRPCSPLISWR
jgi:hypothetical protein